MVGVALIALLLPLEVIRWSIVVTSIILMGLIWITPSDA
jgi:hypothetical protein